MRILLCLLWLMIASVQAIELDSTYFPTRTQWYSVDDAFSQNQFIWQHGRFLRLRFDKQPQHGMLFIHGEGGLFKQLKPYVIHKNDQWHYLYQRNTDSAALVVLDDFSEYPALIEQSKHTTAPKLKVVSDDILHDEQQVSVNRSEGFSKRDYNYFEAGQTLQYTLEGPGEFHFVLRAPWQESYGNAELMEVFLAQEQQAYESRVLKIQPEPNYLLETPWCECRYSRRVSTALLLGEGEHKIKVKADRKIVGYWTKDNQDEAYLFAHNAHLDKALIPKSINDDERLPELYFYRSLNPVKAAEITVRQIAEDKQGYFTQIDANQSNRFDIPKGSRNPPLRVLLDPAHKQPVHLSLLSDSGEQVQFYHSGEYTDESLPLQYVHFSEPYSQVTVQNLQNTPLSINLGYKNHRRYQTTEENFVGHIDNITAKNVINMLLNEPLRLTSRLLEIEVQDWRHRLTARLNSFIERHPSQHIAGDVEVVKSKLGELTSRRIDSLEQLMAIMQQHGLALPAKRWLAYTAMGSKSEQQRQAEQLFLDNLAQQEHWFDIEGYWAYRLIKHQEQNAMIPLAQVLLRQNRFAMAAKWFWLADKAQLQPSLPVEAMMASYKAGFNQMNRHYSKQQPDIEFPNNWLFWQDVAFDGGSDSTNVLVHNLALDRYFDTVKLERQSTQKMTLHGPGRFKLALYPSREISEQWHPTLNLTLTADETTRHYELGQVNDSLSLIDALHQGVLGSPKSIVFDLPPGEHDLGLMLDHHHALLVIDQQTDLLAGWNVKKAPVYVANRRLDVTEPSRSEALDEQALLASNDYRWQRLQSVVKSGGRKVLAFDSWQGLSERGKLQQALFVDNVELGERLVSNQGTEVLEVQTSRDKLLTLKVREIPRFGYPVTPSKVVLEYGHTKQLASLPLETTLPLTPGAHQIRLSLANEQGYYRGKAVDEQSRAWAFFSVSGLQLPSIKRAFHVSTHQDPLVVEVPGNTWLRVDRGDGHSAIEFYPQAKRLELHPLEGEVETLYQLYRWRKVAHIMENLALDPVETSPFALTPEVTYWMQEQDDVFRVLDQYEADQQQDGTWGLFGGYRARRNFDENEQTAKEQFYQLGWAYRLNLPDYNTHLASDIALRKHQNTDLETITFENTVNWQHNRYWDTQATLNLYHQYRAPNRDVEGGTGAYYAVAANWRQYWGDDIRNRVTLSAFGRYLSLSEQILYPGHSENAQNEVIEDGLSVDDDVYSDYKEDNPRGLRLSDVWQYQPYLDTRIRLAASITSDKHFNLLNPQSLRLSAGLRQYYEPFILSMDLRHVRFKRQSGDLDNESVLKRNSLHMGLLFEHWRLLGELGQVELFASSDLDSGQSSFGINFHWYFSHGQGYDDFAPSRLVFGDLRRRMGYHSIASSEVVKQDHD